MREKNYFANKFVSLVLVVCMVLGLVVIPQGVNEHSHVHAESGNGTAQTVRHDCKLEPNSFTQQMMDAFVAVGRIDCGSYDFKDDGPMFLSAASDIHWEGEVVLPDGAFIVICTAGHDYTMGTVIKEGKGGVYIIDCSTLESYHKDCNAFFEQDAEPMYVTQAYVDLMLDYFDCYGEGASPFGGDSYVALVEDVVLKSELAIPPVGSTLYVCENGYSLTWAEGIDPNAPADPETGEPTHGNVVVLDCSDMPKYYHTCGLTDRRTDPLTQTNVGDYISQLAYMSPRVVYLHLTEDVSFEGTVVAPYGVYVVICLNGFTLTGTVDNNANTHGGVFTHTCGDHACSISGQTVGSCLNLSQGTVDFIEAYAAQYGRLPSAVSEPDIYALIEDVTFSSDFWLPDSSSTLIICKNGHKLTDNVGLNLAHGDVMYVDCTTYGMSDIIHESILSNMGLPDSLPMAQETLNDLVEAMKPYKHSYAMYAQSWNRWNFLGSDGKIYYMPYNLAMNDDGTITAVAATENNEYSLAQDFCLTALYDSNGYSTNSYAYCVSVTDPENSGWRYSKYIDILPVLDGEGRATGEVRLAFVDSPTTSFTKSSTYDTYTATVDGVEYYIGSPDGSGAIAACPVSALADGGACFADWSERYRFNGRDGVFAFHLSEDVSWEGTLSVPDMHGLVIYTNGHTATGDYTHGAMGGVYIFDDRIHACPAMGDSDIPMPVSNDFLALMYTMSGGQIEMEGNVVAALTGDLTEIPDGFTISAGARLSLCVNGYTISEEVLAALRAGGGVVHLIDCSDMTHDCEKLGGQVAEPANSYVFANHYQDANGVFALGPGEYWIYLAADVKLQKTLVIPAGVTLHLCLNGFTLTSPRIVTSESEGYTKDDFCFGAINVEYGGSLTVYDCSEGEVGLITVNVTDGMVGLGGLVAYAVANSGTFVLDSGSMFGLVPVINAGDLTVDGGSVVGVLAATLMTGAISDVGLNAADATPSITVNGGSINSLLIGIAGENGEITVNGGEIAAGMLGISNSLKLDDPASATLGADLALNGGSLTVGEIDPDVYKGYGLDVDDEWGEVTDGPVAVTDQDIIYGVVSTTGITVSEDFKITVNELAKESAEESADILLGEGATLTVTESKVGIDNSFSVGTNVSITGGGNDTVIYPTINAPDGTVTGGNGSAITTDKEGNTIVVSGDDIARVAGATASTSGLLKLNFYVSAVEEFLVNEDARVLITFKSTVYEYRISDGRRSGDLYAFSIDVNAKDFRERAYVTFTNGDSEWGNYSISLDEYLSALIYDSTGTYDDVKEFARYIRNYCATAALYFGTETYWYRDSDIQAKMDSYTPDVFAEYAYTVTGTSDNVVFAGSSLLLETGTTIRLFFTVAQGVDVNTLTVTVDGKSTTLTKRGSYYYVDIDNVAAKNLATFYTVDFDGVTVKYCALSYAWYALNSSVEPSADLVDVCEALLGYYVTAYEYANR